MCVRSCVCKRVFACAVDMHIVCLQYAFFLEHFNLPGNGTEMPLDPIHCSNLTVTATGQIGSDPAYADAVFAPDLVAQFAAANEQLLTSAR